MHNRDVVTSGFEMFAVNRIPRLLHIEPDLTAVVTLITGSSTDNNTAINNSHLRCLATSLLKTPNPKTFLYEMTQHMFAVF